MKTDGAHAYPRLRWLGLAWLVVFLPTSAMAYRLNNFLFICELGVILTAVAFITGNRILVSSQAVASPIIGVVWILDAGWRLVTGDFLFGGTAYMWDPQFPLFARLLSLYHIGWPLLVLWCVARTGYDRRGWALQAGIAAAGILVSRLGTDPASNVNYAFSDPFFGVQIGPAPVHLMVTLIALAGVGYGLTHGILIRIDLAYRSR